MHGLGRAIIVTLAVVYLLAPAPAGAASPHKIGAVTWHPARYVSQRIALRGYVLVASAGYVLFSDEPTGKVSAHDLPVVGTGIDQLRAGRRYVIRGTFVDGGLKASNGYRYHLELTEPAMPDGQAE